MEDNWINLADEIPDNGLLVETKIHDEKGERNFALLKRRNRLWFFAGESLYVYYTPTHWRFIKTDQQLPQNNKPT